MFLPYSDLISFGLVDTVPVHGDVQLSSDSERLDDM